jgi:hypothetical protein
LILVIAGGISGGAKAVVFVGSEDRVGNAELLKLGDAFDAMGAIFGFAEGGEQQAGEDRDDGDDDEQFDERKPARGDARNGTRWGHDWRNVNGVEVEINAAVSRLRK